MTKSIATPIVLAFFRDTRGMLSSVLRSGAAFVLVWGVACSSSGASSPDGVVDGGSSADSGAATSDSAAGPVSDSATGSSRDSASDSATGSSRDSASDSATGPSGDAASDSMTPGTTAVTGTVGGKSFKATSGFFFVDPQGAVDLVLSDKADLCGSVTQAKIHPGETLVQLYSLAGTAPGPFKAQDDDVKYATVKTTCAPNAPVEGAEVAAASRSTTSVIVISLATATKLEGTVSLSFQDGSSVSGSFSVAACASTLPETSTCF